MSSVCPYCSGEVQAALFDGGRAVVCDCGWVLRAPDLAPRTRPGHAPPPPPEGPPPESRGGRDPRDERTRLMEELKRKAEKICVHILRSDYPEVDIAVERALLREFCEKVFPDRMDLYDMVYESRFERLIEQFGADREG